MHFRLQDQLRLYRAGFAWTLALMTLLNIGQLLKPFPLKLIIDSLTGTDGGRWGALTGSAPHVVLLATFCLLGLQAAVSFLQVRTHRAQSRIVGEIISSLRERTYTSILAMPLRQQTRHGSGELLHRLLNDADSVWDLIVYGILPICQATLLLLGMSAVMLWLDPWLTLAALSVVPPLFFVTRRSFDRIADDTRSAREAEGALYDQVQETLSQRLAISAFALERRQLERFQAAGRRTFAQVATVLCTQVAHGARADLMLAGGTALIFVLGAQRVLTHQLGLGDLVLFVSYLTMLYQPLNQLSLGVGRIANAQAALARVEAVISDAAPLRDGAVELKAEDLRGHVKLENVSFSYGRDRPILANLSLEIQPGEKVAIVGGSGAGKSTLLALLLRLDDPDAGRILLDGIELKAIRLASLRQCLAVVPQPPALFAGTIRLNLTGGEECSDETEMREAVEQASLSSTFARLPQGFDQEIGERGQQLSEGERQRLALARALLRRAPVLLLDEPTSALDTANEEHIVATLRHSLKGHTVILVSHRLAPLQAVDRILVLEHGRIVEEGSFAELVACGGVFSAHLQAQQTTEDLLTTCKF